MNVIKWIQKKSKKSERKFKKRNSNSSDDQMYPDINNEQTPEYLSAIAQFLERRSSVKINVNELEENISSPNLHNMTPNKVKFAEKESDDRTDNENSIINGEIVERSSFSSFSKKNSNEDTGDSTFSNTKLFNKNNESRTENKNTSSSVNYEKFQTGKINDSLRKHGTIPSTSFEVSSDSNIQSKHNTKIPSGNNLNGSEITANSKRKIMDTTDSNTSEILHTQRSNVSIKNSTKISSNSIMNVNVEPLVMDSNTNTDSTTIKQITGYQARKTSLYKENIDKINGFIKHTGKQSAKENSQMEFTSYVPFIPFDELKWHKTSLKADFGWYCEWRKPTWNNTLVLIRRIKSSTLRNSNILITEINALTSIRHPNILVLMGYTFDSGDYLMPIYQYFRHSLYCHLHEMACALSLPKIIRIILQITEALSFTHMMGIIHTTISSHCIALSDDFNNAKIFGFDYSVSKNSGKIVENIGRKQWYQWLAPELFESQSPRKAQVSLDIYSLCAVLWECCYLTVPWKNISYTQLSQVYTKWRMGIPLTNNRYLPTEIYNILKTGFQIDSNQRSISLTEIMSILREMQKQFQIGENIFLFTSIEQLSSEMNLQKVIIKKYITPENIYQQLSTTTTPSPKSISTNESPQDHKGLTYKESEKVDDENSIQTPKTSKSKLLHKITDFDKSSLKTSPRKIIISTTDLENFQKRYNKQTQIVEDKVDAVKEDTHTKCCTKETEIDNSIVNATKQPSKKMTNSINNLEEIPKFCTKETEIDNRVIQEPSQEIMNTTTILEQIPKFVNKKSEFDETILLENTPKFHTKSTVIDESIINGKSVNNEQILQQIILKVLSPTINIINSDSSGVETDEIKLDETSQETSVCKTKKMNMKNNLQDKKEIDDTIQSSSKTITSKLIQNENLNKQFDEIITRKYDIKKLIYEYEILTKHLHDSVVPSVNFDRTKLYVRNTDVKPASHRTTITEVPVTTDSPEYLMEKKKKNLPTFKLSVVQQQKHLCINELKNFFEHYLWKKEKNKCLQMKNTISFKKIKSIKKTNFQQRKKVKKPKIKLFRLKENDSKIHFIKGVIIEVIDAAISYSENYNSKLLKTNQINFTNQEIVSYNLKSFQIECLKNKIKSLKEYEIQQQQFYSQIKRILDITNFCINLNNIYSSPTVQTLFTENLTLDVVQQPLFECHQLILFKSPNFMNYWHNVLQLYITSQLRDAYIDDDFTSDAVQLTSDMTEFCIFVEDLQDKRES